MSKQYQGWATKFGDLETLDYIKVSKIRLLQSKGDFVYSKIYFMYQKHWHWNNWHLGPVVAWQAEPDLELKK